MDLNLKQVKRDYSRNALISGEAPYITFVQVFPQVLSNENGLISESAAAAATRRAGDEDSLLI